ncbi:Fic family protein [Bradyrhizobium sp. LMTR 3]|uniref:Fic/DOC family protein n=1 Tax=Bradyrhizobium sp. LMTR 3 TaxID=189873 RepID=UPI000810A496|nr:Fic family protein [Bradyrhizobium sp. LMTR 3]OCK58823.1 cell filamentation protein Fic [Bradyrhizobium sp. LMTR 3]
MSFDPFGDLATEGYLRNVAKEKDLDIVKRLEHTSFTTGLDAAFAALRKSNKLSYANVLETHGILFNAIYPWAGQDRLITAPNLTVRKGSVIFANPAEIRPAIEYALRKGQDKDYLRAYPGEILGYLAFGHPFLDGNGRTIVTLFSVIAQRAGFSIDWSATDKEAYLSALTKEIRRPSKGHLDNYLRQFVRAPITLDNLTAQIVKAPGLDGRDPAGDENEVVGDIATPEVKKQYEAMLIKRRQND